MAENQECSMRIRGAKMQETTILSGRAEFRRDGDTRFEAEVPQYEYHEEPPLPENTIDIKDSAISSLVLCSEDTKIDNRGGKTSIKIRDQPDAMQHPEGDVPLADQPRDSGGTNVMINTVVRSQDSNIDMTGLQFRYKPKRGQRVRNPIQTGQINVSNTACVNLVAHSVGTTIDTTLTDVKIE